MPKRYCYVHIGAPKTGTTMLQKVLFENRDRLAQQTLAYPDVSLRGYGHHDLAFLLWGGYPEWATQQPRSLDELARELEATAKSHAGSLLLSSEDFFLYPNPGKLHELLENTGSLDGREARIIVYVRRQDDAHESWYNQTVKAQGYAHGIEESLEAFSDLWDYDVQLSRWADAFGESSLVVRPFETNDFWGGSLLNDFTHILGIDASSLDVTQPIVNTGLNRDILEFQRILNRLPLDTVERRRFHRSLIDLTAKAAGTGLFDESPILSTAQRRRILGRYAASNARVAQRFLERPALFDTEVPENERTSDASGLTAEKIAAIFAWLLVRGDGS